MSKTREWIEGHFGLILIFAVIAGFILPGADKVPDSVLLYLLAGNILYSCSKISIDELFQIKIFDVLILYIVRFLLAAIAIYFIASTFFPDYKYGLLLLVLLPCGVTLPAIAAIMKGNTTLGLTATVFTSVLAPIVIPSIFAFVQVPNMQLDTFGMFQTLVCIIFLPSLLYFFILQKIPKIQKVIQRDASAGSIILIFIVAVLVIAEVRDQIFSDLDFLLVSILLVFPTYFLFYAWAWFAYHKREFYDQLSYTLISGTNNIALGVSLAVLYFSDAEIYIMVIGEVVWIISMSVFQSFISKQSKRLS